MTDFTQSKIYINGKASGFPNPLEVVGTCMQNGFIPSFIVLDPESGYKIIIRIEDVDGKMFYYMTWRELIKEEFLNLPYEFKF